MKVEREKSKYDDIKLDNFLERLAELVRWNIFKVYAADKDNISTYQ